MSPVFYYKYSLSDGVWKIKISAKNRKKSAEKFAGIKKMRTFASAFEKNA